MSCILHQNRGKVPVTLPLFDSYSVTSSYVRREKNRLLAREVMHAPGRYRAYTPGSVGCCTIGLGGLVGLVFGVVVDAAPSSRVKAMIQAIMGASSCLALPFPPQAGSVSTKKSVRGMRPAIPHFVGR